MAQGISIGNIVVGDDSLRIGNIAANPTTRSTNASSPYLKGDKGDKGDKR